MSQKIFSRDFVLSFFSQLTSTSMTAILIPTLPIYLSSLGAKEAEIGVLIGVFSVSALLTRPFVGRGLVNHPEKRFMVIGALIYLMSSMGYLAAVPFFSLFAVRAFHGVGLALFSTAAFTLVARISPEAHRGQALVYYFLAINFAMAAAPAAGMFLINLWGTTALFLVCTGLSLCTLLLSLRFREVGDAPLQDPSSKEFSFFNREALSPAVNTLISNTLWGAITAFFPLYAIRHGVDNPGYFFSVHAVALILVRTFGGRVLDIYAREKVILPCFALHFTAMILLTFSTTLPMFILAAVLWGVGSSYLFPTLVLLCLERAGPSKRGPAMGTYTALSDLGSGLGSVVMGIILQWSSYRFMFLCLAFCSLVNFVYYYAFVFRKGRIETVRLEI